MGTILDTWTVSFTLGVMSKEHGEVTVRASDPEKALTRFKEIVTADATIIEMSMNRG